MHHYPFHPGDYMLDTAHLEPLEDLAYRRLLDLYYSSEAPIPLETELVSRRLRLGADYKARADRARQNGKNGGRPKTQGKKPTGLFLGSDKKPTCNPEETGSKANQNQNQNQNQEPNINPLPLTAPAPPALVDEQKLEVGSWFGRRASTQWSAKELKAWNALELETITEGIELLKPAYLAKTGEAVKYRRRDLQTLLNNWTGEIDRWRNWQAPAASDVTNRQQDELPAFLDDDNAIFHPQAA